MHWGYHQARRRLMSPKRRWPSSLYERRSRSRADLIAATERTGRLLAPVPRVRAWDISSPGPAAESNPPERTPLSGPPGPVALRPRRSAE